MNAAIAKPPAAAPPQTLAQSLRELPRVFWINWVGVFLNRFGHFVLPFLTLWITGRGWTEADAAWATGLFSAGSLTAALLGGWLADRFGRKRTMVFSLGGGAGLLLLLGAARTPQELWAACFAYGLVGNCLGPASQAFIGDVVPPSLRLAAYTAHRMAINLGFAAGPVVAGWLMTRSPWTLFVADAATSVAYAGIVLLALPETRAATPREKGDGWGPALRLARRDGALLTFLAAVLLMSVAFRQFGATLPLQIKAGGGSDVDVGLVFGLNGLIIILAELALAQVTRHWRLRGAMALGAVIIGLGLALNAAGPSVRMAAISMAVLTLGEMLAFSRTATYGMSRAPESMRGRYSGLMSLGWGVGDIVGATVGLMVYARSPEAVWIGCLVVCLASAACLRWYPASPPPQLRE